MLFGVKTLAIAAVLLSAMACTGGAPATQGAGPTQAVATPTQGSVAPAPKGAFSGSLEAAPGIGGTISFGITETGQILAMDLEGGLTNYDCGGGRTIVDSGPWTYFFLDPLDPLVIQSGRFSVSRPDLDWDGVFDSATSVHGNIRLSGGSDCQNRPPSVTWSATSG